MMQKFAVKMCITANFSIVGETLCYKLIVEGSIPSKVAEFLIAILYPWGQFNM
jgi:hypothetical protein